jgi:hypothetical protein
MNLRPNAPRMVTVLIALALLVVGVAGTLIDPETVGDLVRRIGLPNDTERDVLALIADRTIAYACLFGSPMLLVIGSLLPGI